MKMKWIVRALGIVLIVLIVIAGFGQAVLQLWNWLMPAVFGLHPITFWQAVGLLGLSWILFGGWRGFRGRPANPRNWRNRMMERCEQMTPEERHMFREGVRNRCGQVAPPETEPKA